MAKINLINKDSLPELFESLAETAVKSLDELDVFKHDGLLSSIPLGKIVSYFAKKVIQINDLDEALSKAIKTSALFAYVDGLRKYDINPVVEDVFLKESLSDMKRANLGKKFGFISFDINSFVSSPKVRPISLELT